MRYFVAGNLWLLVSLVLILGKKVERGDPTMYSFFGVGGWHYPGSYWLMVLACAGLGVAFLIIARRQ